MSLPPDRSSNIVTIYHYNSIALRDHYILQLYDNSF